MSVRQVEAPGREVFIHLAIKLKDVLVAIAVRFKSRKHHSTVFQKA